MRFVLPGAAGKRSSESRVRRARHQQHDGENRAVPPEDPDRVVHARQ